MPAAKTGRAVLTGEPPGFHGRAETNQKHGDRGEIEQPDDSKMPLIKENLAAAEAQSRKLEVTKNK